MRRTEDLFCRKSVPGSDSFRIIALLFGHLRNKDWSTELYLVEPRSRALTQPSDFLAVASAVPVALAAESHTPRRIEKVIFMMFASRAAIDSMCFPTVPIMIGACGFCTGLGCPSKFVTV